MTKEQFWLNRIRGILPCPKYIAFCIKGNIIQQKYVAKVMGNDVKFLIIYIYI